MEHYTTREVTKLLGLSPAQVRAYARAGFLSPRRGPRNQYRFSFQDLVILRTAAGLVEARVPPARIRRALRELRQQLPRGRTLSELRIAAVGDRILVSDGGAPWNPESGQLHLEFSVSELANRVQPLAERASEPPPGAGDDAETWYDLALELEGQARDAAKRAYARALELEPRHADALVNLGRLLHEEGDAAAAAEHYRRALAVDAQHATAAYNLGVALEELGECSGARRAYERAIGADPELADAHFNLARLCEETGDARAAIRHLTAYRRLADG